MNPLAVTGSLLAILLWVTLVGGSIAAWITHVIICIKSASWVLLAFGCIVAPIGVIHGIGSWFGVF